MTAQLKTVAYNRPRCLSIKICGWSIISASIGSTTATEHQKYNHNQSFSITII